MAHRPPRPAFGHGDKLRLIDLLRTTRAQVVSCAAAEQPGSELAKLCQMVTAGLDSLAEELTGDRKILLPPVHGTPALRFKDPSSSESKE
jgi:hypothetical protein